VLLLEELDLIPAEVYKQVDIYVVAAGQGTLQQAFKLSELLRDTGDYKVLQNAGGGSFKSQMKKADKSGASIALILGEQEIKNDVVVIKPLSGDLEQTSVNQSDIINELNNYFKIG
jgi:histidyl-tRNA synthetase